MSRYAGGHKNRVLQVDGKTWLHGHWANNVGVAHYQHWNTHSSRNGGSTDWLVMCGSNGRKVYLGSDPKKNIATDNGHSFSDGDRHLVVNKPSERSEFGVMEVIVWDRKLQDDEMQATVEYLNRKLKHGTA